MCRLPKASDLCGTACIPTYDALEALLATRRDKDTKMHNATGRNPPAVCLPAQPVGDEDSRERNQESACARTPAASVAQVRSSQATRSQRRMLAWARGAAMRADGAAQGQPGCAANATAAALQRSRRRYYLPSEATCRVGAAASDRAHSRPSQGRCSGCHAQAVWLQVCSAGEHTARTRADAGRAGRGS